MRFNNFVWELYKNSTEGKEEVEKWIPLETFPDNENADDCDKTILDELISKGLTNYVISAKVNWSNLLLDYFRTISFSVENAKNIYSSWISEGVKIHDFELISPNNFQHWTTEIPSISSVLFPAFPEYFFPYNFDFEFNTFRKICTEFNIPVPEVPMKKDWEKRALYYLDLCNALFEFRKINGFSPAELCAFLYDFAPKVLNELEDIELPPPSKVWFVGGNKLDFDFLDNAINDTESYWQGNVDAKKGDIVIMYCLSPRSYIHSIWRVVTEGFADPFFYYYSLVYISHPIKLDFHITQKDLEKNEVWSKNPKVRANMQGITGYPIKYSEYLELLSMLKVKGEIIDNFPMIKPTSRLNAEFLTDERDVEIKLIEPFLELIGYKPMDWIRQMPVKMGRGERNYPDYCFGANPARGEETAKMILESKFGIKTQKELQDAYFQTKSYALRLQSEKFVIASKEGIWVFQPKKAVYKFDDYFHCNWLEMENPDILHKLQLMIGKQ